MFENGGFIHLQRNKYLRRHPVKLTHPYYYGEPEEIEMPQTLTSSVSSFHEIHFKVKDEMGKGKMLDFKRYQEYLIFGKVPEECLNRI